MNALTLTSRPILTDKANVKHEKSSNRNERTWMSKQEPLKTKSPNVELIIEV